MPQREPTGYRPPELKFKKSSYAQSKNLSLPRQYFVMAAIAPRGVGKTYSTCQLLKAYEDSPPIDSDGNRQGVRIFVISPTFQANECFKALKNLDEDDVYGTYSEGVLKEILEKIEHENEETKKYQEAVKRWKRFQKAKRPEDLSQEDLLWLDMNDFEPPETPKYPHGVSNFLVVDDMVGSSVYKQGQNPFTNLLLKNRHHRINIVLLAQSLKSIPRTVRGNVSVWWIGRFGTRSHLPDLYEECGSALCREDQFEELYDAATQDQHGALVIDFSQPKDKRFSQSFHTVLKP